MESVKQYAGIVSVVLINIINGLMGFGVVLPTGVDVQGVALGNAAALSVAAFIMHFTKPAAAPAPTDPVA
jgi:hypothetical protein